MVGVGGSGDVGGAGAPPAPLVASDGEPREVVCAFCGAPHAFHSGRHCAVCDAPGCEHCVTPGSEALCPDCEARALPAHVEPMLARLSSLPRGDGWGCEFKWDGVRCLAYWDGRDLRLESRRLNDVTGRYPEFRHAFDGLGEAVVLDGELVALDASGRPSFARLQRRMHLSPGRAAKVAARVPVFYFVFDVLQLGGESLLERPYRERREVLEGLAPAGPRVRVPRSHADGAAMLAAAREHALEGVVAKRLDSRYEPGRRSGAWRKVKLVRAQEFVIGGWTPQAGIDRKIGSLLLGVYDDGGRLRYVGRVGSGFSDDDHRRLLGLLRPLETDADPFALEKRPVGLHAVTPELVVQVAYRRWPEGGRLQQTAFEGLRADVPPGDVVRERPEVG